MDWMDGMDGMDGMDSMDGGRDEGAFWLRFSGWWLVSGSVRGWLGAT